MRFFKSTVICLFLVCAMLPMHPMEREQAIAGLLEQYPAPSIRTSCIANLFCCDTKRKLIHKHAIKDAEAAGDELKVDVLEHVYDGYYRLPEWLSSGPDWRIRNETGKTYLSTAINAGRDDLVAVLLSHGAPPNTGLYSAYISYEFLCLMTPLHRLIKSFPENNDNRAPYEHIAKLLVGYGADVNAQSLCCRDHGKTSPLVSAIKLGKVNLARVLINLGADIDFLDEGQTLLCRAALGKDQDKVEMLLSLGADVNAGHSPLPYLLEHKTYHGISKLLSLLIKEGIALDGKNKYGETVVESVVRWGTRNEMRKVLEAAPFTRTRAQLLASRKRMMAALCVFNRFRVPRDLRNLLVTCLYKDVSNVIHYWFLLLHNVSLEKLVPYCQIDWLNTLYQVVDEKDEWLEKTVSLVVAYRLSKINDLFKRLRSHIGNDFGVFGHMVNLTNFDGYKVAIEKRVHDDIVA